MRPKIRPSCFCVALNSRPASSPRLGGQSHSVLSGVHLVWRLVLPWDLQPGWYQRFLRPRLLHGVLHRTFLSPCWTIRRGGRRAQCSLGCSLLAFFFVDAKPAASRGAFGTYQPAEVTSPWLWLFFRHSEPMSLQNLVCPSQLVVQSAALAGCAGAHCLEAPLEELPDSPLTSTALKSRMAS